MNSQTFQTVYKHAQDLHNTRERNYYDGYEKYRKNVEVVENEFCDKHPTIFTLYMHGLKLEESSDDLFFGAFTTSYAASNVREVLQKHPLFPKTGIEYIKLIECDSKPNLHRLVQLYYNIVNPTITIISIDHENNKRGWDWCFERNDNSYSLYPEKLITAHFQIEINQPYAQNGACMNKLFIGWIRSNHPTLYYCINLEEELRPGHLIYPYETKEHQLYFNPPPEPQQNKIVVKVLSKYCTEKQLLTVQ